LPLDLLAAVGLDRDSFLAGEDAARIGAAVEAFAGIGREHLDKARAAGRLPASIMPAYLPAALSGPVLDHAARLGFRIFEDNLRPPQWRRQWRMLKATAFRRI